MEKYAYRSKFINVCLLILTLSTATFYAIVPIIKNLIDIYNDEETDKELPYKAA